MESMWWALKVTAAVAVALTMLLGVLVLVAAAVMFRLPGDDHDAE